MSTATDGRRREHKVRHDLESHGWVVYRSAGSKGAADLIAGSLEQGVALVQVGTPSKRLGPADRMRLLNHADHFNALPILARVIPRGPIQYLLVNPGPRWEAWTP